MSKPRASRELGAWLAELGLGAYAEVLAANGIDWDVLADLSESDLKELGFSLGDRKRLLKAIAAIDKAPTIAKVEPPLVSQAKPTVGEEAERRQITVMFIDLVDATPLSGQLDPEDMREVLHSFHEVCASAIELHEGHIAQYLGDGILVYFGYPRAHEDDAVRAVRAGLGILDGLRLANERLALDHSVCLQVRVGVHSGLVVIGEIGAGEVRDSRAIVGETPNVAARLQMLASPDTMVISSVTHRLCEGAFIVEDLGLRQLKGVAEAVRICRVLAESESADRFDARARQGLTPIVGRAAELEMLRQRWTQACDGEMRCVLVVGDPGIGKSRTVRAFRDGIADAPHDAVTMFCSAYHQNSAFWPVLDWLNRVLRLERKNDVAGDAAKLQAAILDLGLDYAELGPVFTAFLSLRASPGVETADVSSPLFKLRAQDALIAVIAATAKRRPVLIVIEDAHWIDPSSLEFLRLLLERLTEARLLLLLTARPEFKPEWNYPHLLQINLDRLSRRDRLAMVERLTGGKPLPQPVMDQIVTTTDGVPLFVEELTKAVLETGIVRDAGDQYVAAAPISSLTIPDTLQGSLLARLDRLEPAARECAQIASVVGREFAKELLGRVCGWADDALTAALASLVKAEIVLPAPRSSAAGGAYMFRHALIQDAAYQSLLLTRRRHYHTVISDVLEASFPEIVESQPEILAHHLTAANIHNRAVDYWRRAGQRAYLRNAHEEAAAHLRRGLQVAAGAPGGRGEQSRLSLPLLLLLGRTEIRVNGLQARQTFREAAAIARAGGLPAELASAALGYEEAELFLGVPSVDSVSMLREALSLLSDVDSVERCRVLCRLGRALYTLGSFEQAAEVVQEAAPLARRLGDQRSLFDVLCLNFIPTGAPPPTADKFAERRKAVQELLSVADGLSDANVLTEAIARTFHVHLQMGDFDGFEAALGRHCRMLENVQSYSDRWIGASAMAMRAILVGDFSLAEQQANRALAIAENVSGEFAQGVYGVQMFTIRREQGRLGEVAPLVKRFVDEHPEDAAWRPGLMLIADDLGFQEHARRIFDELAANDFRLPMDAKRPVTLSYLAEVCARLGTDRNAEEIYRQLLPHRDLTIVMPSVTICCGAAARYLGMLAALMGDWETMEAHFEAALVIDGRMNAAPWLAHTQHEYARAMLIRGRGQDFPRAKRMLLDAGGTAERLGMGLLRHRLRAGLAAA